MSDQPTVTIESVVDPGWIEFCTRDSDVFSRNYCGYWMRGVEFNAERGWLIWEDDERHRWGKEPNRAEALRCWEAGKPLPTGWHRFTVETAIKAWAEGVKWRGERWYEDGDGPAYDYAIQMAMFGAQKYG